MRITFCESICNKERRAAKARSARCDVTHAGKGGMVPVCSPVGFAPLYNTGEPPPPRGRSNFPYIRARRGGGGPASPRGLTPAVPYAGLWGLMHFLCTFYALSTLILLYLQIMHKKISFFETPIICIILLFQ